MRAWLVVVLACSDPQPEPQPEPEPEPEPQPEPDPQPQPGEVVQAVVIGDSIAAGYNAPGQVGYAQLIAGELGVPLMDLAESGATSDDARARVAGASFPPADGGVIVLINVGGNDFNDSVSTILDASQTAAAAATLRENLRAIVGDVRASYPDAAVYIDTIHDPTDGMGTVPPEFDEGFCEMLHNPLLTPSLRQQALTNLGTMNAAITGETSSLGAYLVDVHGAFMGHGMNSGGERLIDGDCAHFTGAGHAFLKGLIL